MGIFTSVKVNRPKRSAFNLSHEKKLSMKMGSLVPCMLEEVMPGDTFKAKSEILMRFAPMISPIMHRVDVYTHYFFVPNRIVWENWKEFITGGEDGLSAPSMPTVQYNTTNNDYFVKGMLNDYYGLPVTKEATTVNQNMTIGALPFRAYQEIYNEYYRDQNLQGEVVFSKGDTATETQDLLTTRARAWEKDYFTSALPWTQRGGEVSSPLTHNYLAQDKVIGSDGNPILDEGYLKGANDGELYHSPLGDSNGSNASLDNSDNLGVTINDLRQSVRLQEWLERNARAGSRYIEQILSHFGVKSSDSRLQRPEYLGGGKNPVTISEVLNTTGATGANPQGEMAGHGISVGNLNGFKRSFEEHGYIIGIVSVLPRTAYQNGIPKTFMKYDKLEFAWPEFANLGEQAVYTGEVHYDPEIASSAFGTFGYQSRYAEYKFGRSTVSGDFRDTLSHWHMGRQLTDAVLNDDFIRSNPRTDIFAVDDGTDHLYVQIYNAVQAIRPLPYYGTPRL